MAIDENRLPCFHMVSHKLGLILRTFYFWSALLEHWFSTLSHSLLRFAVTETWLFSALHLSADTPSKPELLTSSPHSPRIHIISCSALLAASKTALMGWVLILSFGSSVFQFGGHQNSVASPQNQSTAFQILRSSTVHTVQPSLPGSSTGTSYFKPAKLKQENQSHPCPASSLFNPAFWYLQLSGVALQGRPWL